MVMTKSEWGEVLISLLPRGPLFRAAAVLQSFLAEVAGAFSRADSAAEATSKEVFPDTATTTLERWSDVFGVALVGDDAADQQAVTARVSDNRSPAIQAIQSASDLVAGAVTEVIETGSSLAKISGDERQIYKCHVYCNPATIPGVDSVQATLDSLSHAHIKLTACQSKRMKFDDQYSRFDRDILGV